MEVVVRDRLLLLLYVVSLEGSEPSLSLGDEDDVCDEE